AAAAQATALPPHLSQVLAGNAAGIPMPPGAPSAAQIQEMVGAGPTYMPWPSHRPAVRLPFFQCDMIKNVNLDTRPSSHTGGLDLPFNDITTLRFFFNLGVQQSRVILLSLHFIQVYCETSLHQRQRLPDAGTASAVAASAHTTLQQQQLHIQAQQRRSVHAASVIAAQQQQQHQQRYQQALHLSCAGGEGPSGASGASGASAAYSQQPVIGGTHDAEAPGGSGITPVIAQRETAQSTGTKQTTVPSAAAAAAGSEIDETTCSAAIAEEMAEADSSTAFHKQKAQLTASGNKDLKVTSLNNLVLKLTSTKHDRQRQQKQQTGPSCTLDALDATATIEAPRSAISVSVAKAPLRLEHAHCAQPSALPGPQQCQQPDAAAAAGVRSSPKRPPASGTTQPAAHEDRATDKQDMDKGPALAPLLMVSYFNSHFGKAKMPLLPPRPVTHPTEHSDGIFVSHGYPNPPQQQQQFTRDNANSQRTTANGLLCETVSGPGSLALDLFRDLPQMPVQLEHANRPDPAAGQQHKQHRAPRYSAIEDTSGSEGIYQPHQAQKQSEGRSPVNSTSWNIHNILSDSPSTSKNGLLPEECESRKRKDTFCNPSIVEPISQLIGSTQPPTFCSSIKSMQQGAIQNIQSDAENLRRLDPTTPSLTQPHIDQSAATVFATTIDENEMATVTSAVTEESSSGKPDDCTNGNASPSLLSAPGTRPEAHNSPGDDESTDDETHHNLAKVAQFAVDASKCDASDAQTVASRPSASGSADTRVDGSESPSHLSAPGMPPIANDRQDDEEHPDDAAEERRRLSMTSQSSLVQVQMIQTAAAAVASRIDVSEVTTLTSTATDESSVESTDACANGASSQASAPGPQPRVHDSPEDEEPAVQHPATTIYSNNDVMKITEMMTLFNDRISAMAGEISSLKEQLAKKKNNPIAVLTSKAAVTEEPLPPGADINGSILTTTPSVLDGMDDKEPREDEGSTCRQLATITASLRNTNDTQSAGAEAEGEGDTSRTLSSGDALACASSSGGADVYGPPSPDGPSAPGTPPGANDSLDDEDPVEGVEEERRRLARRPLSLVRVDPSVAAVAGNKSDLSGRAILPSIGKSSLGCDGNCDYAPSSPADGLYVPETIERPLMEKDDDDERPAGCSDHSSPPNIEPEAESGSETDPVCVLPQAPMRLEHVERVNQSAISNQIHSKKQREQQPTSTIEDATTAEAMVTKQLRRAHTAKNQMDRRTPAVKGINKIMINDTLATNHSKTNGAPARRECSPDIIILESTSAMTAASYVPLTPSQHAAMYRERMAKKLEAEKCRLAVNKSASHTNSVSAHSVSLSSADNCYLSWMADAEGIADLPAGSSGGNGSSPPKPSAPATSSGADEDDGPALAPMLMVSYLKAYIGKETSSTQSGGATPRSKRKSVVASSSRPIDSNIKVVGRPPRRRKWDDAPSTSSASTPFRMAAVPASIPIAVRPHAPLRLERAPRVQQKTAPTGSNNAPSTASLKRPSRACKSRSSSSNKRLRIEEEEVEEEIEL
ncbi:hypothetical protein PENTCL1PPCAC_27968, partial [Pristionchus entomophagus]